MMVNEQLSLLAYTSIACHHMTHNELIELLNTCKEKNQTRHISGMLLYMEGCFFQVLEGHRNVIEQLFEKSPRIIGIIT